MRAIAAALALWALAACAEPTSAQRGAASPPDAETPAAAAEILVRFTGAHPLARAQDLEAAGDHTAAVALARRALAGDTALEGLCFDRFTIGGAEIVLRPCVALAAGAEAQFLNAWIQRLEAMPEVDYAEANMIARAEACFDALGAAPSRLA